MTSLIEKNYEIAEIQQEYAEIKANIEFMKTSVMYSDSEIAHEQDLLHEIEIRLNSYK